MFGHGNHQAESETAEGTGENWRTEAPQKEENVHKGSRVHMEGLLGKMRALHPCASTSAVLTGTLLALSLQVPMLTSWTPSYWAQGTPRPRSSCVPVTCPPQIMLSYLGASPLPCRPPPQLPD